MVLIINRDSSNILNFDNVERNFLSFTVVNFSADDVDVLNTKALTSLSYSLREKDNITSFITRIRRHAKGKSELTS